MYQAPKHSPPQRSSRTRSGAPIDPMRVLSMAGKDVLPRWKPILLVGLTVCAVATWFAPRQFTSKAVLTWEGANHEARDPGRELRTVVDSVKTPANLVEVRRRLAMDGPVEALGRRVEVTFAERSNLITLAATGSDAQPAYDLARTMLAVFLDSRLKHEHARKEKLAAELSLAVEAAEKDLSERRSAWEDFCRANHVGDLHGVLQLALGEGAHLSAARVAARAEAEAEDGRAESLTASAANQSRSVVISQKIVNPTGTKLAEVERELAGLRDQLSPDHPQVLALKAQAAALRAHPDNSEGEVTTERNMGRNPQWDTLQESIVEARAREDAAHRREAALSELANETTQRIGELSEIEGRGSKLSLALRSAETHLSELQARRSQALDEARATATGLAVISAPELPAVPSRSSRKPVALAALVLALFTPLGWAGFRALRGLRLHSAMEVSYWGKAPVVASLAWPWPADGDELEFDIGMPALQCSGTTLLVALGDAERDLVSEAAYRLRCPLARTVEEVQAASGAPLVAFAGDAAAMRRAIRFAPRTLVMVGRGAHSAVELAFEESKLSEAHALAYVIVGADRNLVATAGDAESFWGSEERKARPVELARRAN